MLAVFQQKEPGPRLLGRLAMLFNGANDLHRLLLRQRTTVNTCLRSGLANAILFQWLIIGSFLAIIGTIAATVIAWQVSTELPDPDRGGIMINVVALSIASLISVVTGVMMPAWWRRIVAAAILVPALIFVGTSGNGLVVLNSIAVLLPMTWLGRKSVELFLGQTDALVAWVLGSAFGFGILSVLGFTLGSVGLLRSQLIWPIAIGVVIVPFLKERRRLLHESRMFYVWFCRPSRSDYVVLVLVGISVALLWYNMIGALSPETASDTVRQRLATASYFAQTQHLTANDPELSIAQSPAAGEIAAAVVAAVGPLQAVKLLTFSQGLMCAMAIFAVGRRLHGNQAGVIAAFTFYSMPLVSWLSQTAYLDLLTTLLALSALLVVVSQDIHNWRVVALAGIYSGFGVAVKLHFGYVAVGLVVVLGTIVLYEKRPWEIIRSMTVMITAAALTVGPWLLRSIIVSGQIPGFVLATQSLTRAQDERPAVMSDLTRFGYGRSLDHLLRSLFDTTMFSAQFEWPPTRYGPFGGLIGFMLLGLLPLLVIVLPQSRRKLAFALLVGSAISFLLWFYTAQYLRYGLPILAMLCPLAGVAYALVRERSTKSSLRTAINLALLIFVFSGVVIQLQVPAMGREYVLGRESRDQYLAKNLICCEGYPVVQLLNAELKATRVLSQMDLARIYTTLQVSSFQGTGYPLSATEDEALLLKQLDEGGYSHIVVDRNLLIQGWESLIVLGEPFLRRNTVLVGGENNVYLYRIVPPDQRDHVQIWAAGKELLHNGGFVTRANNVPIGWSAVGALGTTAVDPNGHVAVRATRVEGLITAVTVTPQTKYLLTHRTRSFNDELPGKAYLSLTWRNSAGTNIGEDRETVPVSSHDYHQFSMLAMAPPNAVVAIVSLQAEEGEVWFDDLSLRSIAPDDMRNDAHVQFLYKRVLGDR